MLRALTIFFLLVILSTVTVKRNFVWRDEVTIWRDTSIKSSKKLRPRNNLGIAFWEVAGRPDLAISEHKAAKSIAPYSVSPLYNLSVAYIKLGMYDEAEKELRLAIHLMPESHVLHGNLGLVYMEKGLFDDAESEFKEALRLKPDYRVASDNLIWLRWRRGAVK